MMTATMSDLLAEYYRTADPALLPIVADAVEEAGLPQMAVWLRSDMLVLEDGRWLTEDGRALSQVYRVRRRLEREQW